MVETIERTEERRAFWELVPLGSTTTGTAPDGTPTSVTTFRWFLAGEDLRSLGLDPADPTLYARFEADGMGWLASVALPAPPSAARGGASPSVDATATSPAPEISLALALRAPVPVRAGGRIDLVLVVANAAGYFWAVHQTLEAWRPAAEGPYAVVLAVLYRLVAVDYAARVPDDSATVMLHEGLSWSFLTLAVPLALGGQWITLAWAAEGVVLLWLAAHAPMPVAAWGGLVALLLAAVRVLAVDRYGFSGVPRVWNLTFLLHALVVVALIAGGVLVGRAREVGREYLRTESMRSLLWVAAALTAAALLWREPRGLWPATLLTAEVLVVGYLARHVRSQAFAVAIPALVVILVVRVLAADDGLARSAAGTLLSGPLWSRIGACLAIGIAGGGLATAADPGVRHVGRAISGAAGLILLYALSVGWTRYQDVLRASAPRGQQRTSAGAPRMGSRCSGPSMRVSR